MPGEERRADYMEMRLFMASARDRLDAIHADTQDLNKKVGIQNGRIFKLEKWQTFIFGVCAACGAITTIFGIIPLWLHH